jgi:hypothetical protein
MRQADQKMAATVARMHLRFDGSGLDCAVQHSDWRCCGAALLGRFLPKLGPLATAAFFLVLASKARPCCQQA